MAWFKVDDTFHTSRKVKSIPARHRLAAVGLWTVAGSWCSQELTDGHVPTYMIREWGATPKVVDALVSAGLWDREHDGFVFRSWVEYNPSKARVEDERAASKARMEASRARRRAKRAGQEGDNGNVAAQHPRNSDGVLRRPDPTRPDPTHISTKSSCSSASPPSDPAPSPASDYPADFEAFWSVYPRKAGKRKALAAWKRARKRVTNDELIAGALRYAQDPNREDRYTKHGESWLNGDCWGDDPLPSRDGPSPVTSKVAGWLDLANQLHHEQQPDVIQGELLP